MTNTSVSSDLLQSLNVVTQFRLQVVRKSVVVLSVDKVLLSVEEPGWDLVLCWVLHNSDDSLELFLGQLTGTLLQVDIGLLAHQVGVTTTYTTNGGEGIHNLDSSINVGVEQTNVRENVKTSTYRKMCWKLLASVTTRDMFGAGVVWMRREKNQGVADTA